jgi:hypothetical protein
MSWHWSFKTHCCEGRWRGGGWGATASPSGAASAGKGCASSAGCSVCRGCGSSHYYMPFFSMKCGPNLVTHAYLVHWMSTLQIFYVVCLACVRNSCVRNCCVSWVCWNFALIALNPRDYSSRYIAYSFSYMTTTSHHVASYFNIYFYILCLYI